MGYSRPICSTGTSSYGENIKEKEGSSEGMYTERTLNVCKLLLARAICAGLLLASRPGVCRRGETEVV
jgi:hypothetical protein